MNPWLRDHAILGALVGGGAPAAFFGATFATGQFGFGFHHPFLYVAITTVTGAGLGALWGYLQRAIVSARPDGVGWAAILAAAPVAGFLWGLGTAVAAMPTALNPWLMRWESPDGAFVVLGAMLASTIGALVALALAVIYVPLRLTGAPASLILVPAAFIGVAAGPVGVGLVMAGLFGLNL